MPYDQVNDIPAKSPAKAETFNTVIGSLRNRDDYLKSRLEKIEDQPSAIVTVGIDVGGLSAPFFGYAASKTALGAPIILRSYVDLDDNLQLKRPAFCAGLVRVDAGGHTLYHSGSISNLTTGEIAAFMQDSGPAIPNRPVYLCDSASDAGKGSYSAGIFSIFLGMFINDNTFMLSVDFTDMFSNSPRGQVDLRAYNLTESDPAAATYDYTLTALGATTLTRSATLNKIDVNTPGGPFVTGSITAGDYIRMLPTAPSYTTRFYPICEVNSVTIAAGNITEIYFTYDVPTDGTTIPGSTLTVWGPDGGETCVVVKGIYDASLALGAHSCDLNWRVDNATYLPDWPGNHIDYILFFLNGIAQHSTLASYDGLNNFTADTDGLLYQNVSFPPTYYGWESKIEYMAKARIDRFLKNITSATDNLTISGIPEEPILSCIPELATIVDLSGDVGIKSLSVDPITGKITQKVGTFVKRVNAGSGINLTGNTGNLTISSIQSKIRDSFVKPHYSTSTPTYKSNGMVMYDLAVGNECYFEINIPTSAIDILSNTSFYLIANFTTSSTSKPSITVNYNIMGEGSDDDNSTSNTPNIDTNSFAHINNMSKTKILELKNSNLTGKFTISVKITRGNDSYPGSIYLSGIKTDHYT